MSATLLATRIKLLKLRRTLVLGLALLSPVLIIVLAHGNGPDEGVSLVDGGRGGSHAFDDHE